jgi:hypothetical protein
MSLRILLAGTIQTRLSLTGGKNDIVGGISNVGWEYTS